MNNFWLSWSQSMPSDFNQNWSKIGIGAVCQRQMSFFINFADFSRWRIYATCFNPFLRAPDHFRGWSNLPWHHMMKCRKFQTNLKWSLFEILADGSYKWAYCALELELNVSLNMGLGARRSGSAMKPEINATCRFTLKTPRVLQCRAIMLCQTMLND